MTRTAPFRVFRTVLFSAVLVVPVSVFGQVSRSGSRYVAASSGAVAAEGEVVRIRKLRGLSAQDKIRTPNYQTDLTGPTKPAKEWVNISVSYDTYPEIIEELTFRFYVLAGKRVAGSPAPAYTFYQANVTYLDIEAGRGHEGSVLLRPPALKLHGDLIAVAVEVYHKGEVVGQESDGPRDFAADWWKKVDQPGVTARAGYLLPRSQTPFAFVNPDDYEYARP